MIPHISANIHNKFEVEVRGVNGELKQTAVAYNVILDRMWSRLCAGNTFFTHIQIGTGTGTPSSTDTMLFTPLVAKTITNEERIQAYPTSSWRAKITLAPSENVGAVISEVGIAYSATMTASGGLVTHAMLQDSEGNPITITKTDTDTVTIHATIYSIIYLPDGVRIADMDYDYGPLFGSGDSTNALTRYLSGTSSAFGSQSVVASQSMLDDTVAKVLGGSSIDNAFSAGFTRPSLGTNTITADVPNRRLLLNTARAGVNTANGPIATIGFGSFSYSFPIGEYEYTQYNDIPLVKPAGFRSIVLSSKFIDTDSIVAKVNGNVTPVDIISMPDIKINRRVPNEYIKAQRAPYNVSGLSSGTSVLSVFKTGTEALYACPWFINEFGQTRQACIVRRCEFIGGFWYDIEDVYRAEGSNAVSNDPINPNLLVQLGEDKVLLRQSVDGATSFVVLLRQGDTWILGDDSLAPAQELSSLDFQWANSSSDTMIFGNVGSNTLLKLLHWDTAAWTSTDIEVPYAWLGAEIQEIVSDNAIYFPLTQPPYIGCLMRVGDSYLPTKKSIYPWSGALDATDFFSYQAGNGAYRTVYFNSYEETGNGFTLYYNGSSTCPYVPCDKDGVRAGMLSTMTASWTGPISASYIYINTTNNSLYNKILDMNRVWTVGEVPVPTFAPDNPKQPTLPSAIVPTSGNYSCNMRFSSDGAHYIRKSSTAPFIHIYTWDGSEWQYGTVPITRIDGSAFPYFGTSGLVDLLGGFFTLSGVAVDASVLGQSFSVCSVVNLVDRWILRPLSVNYSINVFYPINDNMILFPAATNAATASSSSYFIQEFEKPWTAILLPESTLDTDVITVSYRVKGIHKTENYVLDVGGYIQFGGS